jgi:predicted enzyme related to lactoylglutathione lyase
MVKRMRPKVVNPVVHLELHTGDLAAARAFYGELCRWPEERIQESSGSYLALDLARRLGGGIVECPAASATWLPYVEVGAVEAATERARSLGAAVLLEPREGPHGWRSVVAAPSAGELALWQPK